MKYDVNWELIRLVVLICGTLMGLVGIICGYLLIQAGATGHFEILGEGKGVKIFLTSVSPGIFIAAIGCVVTMQAFRLQKSCLGMPTKEQLKARGGVEYYKLEDQKAEDKHPKS